MPKLDPKLLARLRKHMRKKQSLLSMFDGPSTGSIHLPSFAYWNYKAHTCARAAEWREYEEERERDFQDYVEGRWPDGRLRRSES